MNVNQIFSLGLVSIALGIAGCSSSSSSSSTPAAQTALTCNAVTIAAGDTTSNITLTIDDNNAEVTADNAVLASTYAELIQVYTTDVMELARNTTQTGTISCSVSGSVEVTAGSGLKTFDFNSCIEANYCINGSAALADPQANQAIGATTSTLQQLLVNTGGLNINSLSAAFKLAESSSLTLGDRTGTIGDGVYEQIILEDLNAKLVDSGNGDKTYFFSDVETRFQAADNNSLQGLRQYIGNIKTGCQNEWVSFESPGTPFNVSGNATEGDDQATSGSIVLNGASSSATTITFNSGTNITISTSGNSNIATKDISSIDAATCPS